MKRRYTGKFKRITTYNKGNIVKEEKESDNTPWFTPDALEQMLNAFRRITDRSNQIKGVTINE